MDIKSLIQHPEQMDRETLYDLRSLVALYPYFQTARLLLLQNLYLLHDPTFDEELRRSAVYLTDRRTLFNLVEAAHYKLRNADQQAAAQATPSANRTISLIDQFLDNIPATNANNTDGKRKRKPTPADATTDYVAYLLETEGLQTAQPMKGQNLIDSFISNEDGRIVLSDNPSTPADDMAKENNNSHEGGANNSNESGVNGSNNSGSNYSNEDGSNDNNNSGSEGEYITETLAHIYIKQGR